MRKAPFSLSLRARMLVGGVIVNVMMLALLIVNGISIMESRLNAQARIHLEEQKQLLNAALYPFADEKAGELACLVVHPEFRNGGAGERMLTEIEQRARRQKLKRLFVLTTRAEHWFVERGFEEAGIDALPQQKRSLYNYQRRSVVLVKRV